MSAVGGARLRLDGWKKSRCLCHPGLWNSVSIPAWQVGLRERWRTIDSGRARQDGTGRVQFVGRRLSPVDLWFVVPFLGVLGFAFLRIAHDSEVRQTGQMLREESRRGRRLLEVRDARAQPPSSDESANRPLNSGDGTRPQVRTELRLRLRTSDSYTNRQSPRMPRPPNVQFELETH